MKALILIAFLIIIVMLAGCASTISPYKQGCYDGLDHAFQFSGDTENFKQNICTSLDEKRSERSRHEPHFRDR